MTPKEQATELQRRYLLSEKTLVFFRDMMSDPHRNPLAPEKLPAGLTDLQLQAWRENALHQAMDTAEDLARTWLSRHPAKIHEFLISQDVGISFLGFLSQSAIMPGETRSVTSRPQLPFVPVEVVIPERIARAFCIVDIRSGYRSCFVSPDPVPGEAFIARELACRLHFPAGHPAMDYTWIVMNCGHEPVVFEASFKGPFLE